MQQLAAHDEGLNNGFLVETSHELALRYNVAKRHCTDICRRKSLARFLPIGHIGLTPPKLLVQNVNVHEALSPNQFVTRGKSPVTSPAICRQGQITIGKYALLQNV